MYRLQDSGRNQGKTTRLKPVSYIGRFAPTPSGPLHFGSIVTALASFLDAKSHHGKWLVRIDDLDPPRVEPGASDKIIQTLEDLGLHWDDDIQYQSSRLKAYEAALHNLNQNNYIYPCVCTRKQLKGKSYPGTCRTQNGQHLSVQHSLRVFCSEEPIVIQDEIQGEYKQLISDFTGDFIVKRSDGLFAYHLANVIDDNWLGITHIVRGVDLLETTPCQVHLQKLFGFKTPHYAHIPVAVDHRDKKISKQHKAEDVLSDTNPTRILIDALEFLGQTPESNLLDGTIDEVIKWAICNWNISSIPRKESIYYCPASIST